MQLDETRSHYRAAAIGRISSLFLSAAAGVAAFVFTLAGFVLLRQLDQQVAASLTIGLFALLVVWVAAERPNSAQARAVAALIERLMAVRGGDLSSPAPPLLGQHMPALAAAVDGLFEQVRLNLDNVHAMALYDPVTSLPNRLHFRREAERILKAAGGEGRSALLFIDLDGFKEVNDRLGHAQGDQVLVMVANRLRIVMKAESREGADAQPLIARLAGDEFTILLPGIDNADEAARIAERALGALGETFRLAGAAAHLGGSIGVALAPEHGVELGTLMKAADIAMYHAKASGRGRVCLYDEALARAGEARAAAEAVLREAVRQDSLELAFQPRLTIRSGTVDAAEAVLQWRAASGEPAAPDGLLGLAERSSLGVEIGQWSLDAAAEALARWRAAGIRQRMALRIGRRQVERHDFFPLLREALSRSGPPPWPVELGIAEAAALELGADFRRRLAALREEGVTIAIDDFGPGYASISSVGELGAERIRLARPLIDAIDGSESARTIAAALIHLVHGLGCEAVADGVERYEQLEVLRAIGCDVVQGRSVAEAMAEKAFLAWIERQGMAPGQARASAAIRR